MGARISVKTQCAADLIPTQNDDGSLSCLEPGHANDLSAMRVLDDDPSIQWVSIFDSKRQQALVESIKLSALEILYRQKCDGGVSTDPVDGYCDCGELKEVLDRQKALSSMQNRAALVFYSDDRLKKLLAKAD